MKNSPDYTQSTEIVARDLIGRTIAYEGRSGRIMETAAYEGGVTPSRLGMLGAPGELFLMSYRGSRLLNIATHRQDIPSCVEIRAIDMDGALVEGPGAVTKALGIPAKLDGIVLGTQVRIRGEHVPARRQEPSTTAKNCVGYFTIAR